MISPSVKRVNIILSREKRNKRERKDAAKVEGVKLLREDGVTLAISKFLRRYFLLK